MVSNNSGLKRLNSCCIYSYRLPFIAWNIRNNTKTLLMLIILFYLEFTFSSVFSLEFLVQERHKVSRVRKNKTMWLQDVQDLQMNRLQINFYSIRGTSCHLQGYFSGLENGGMVALNLFNTFTTLSKAFFGLTLMWTSEPWRNSFYCRVVLCIFLSSKKTPYRWFCFQGLQDFVHFTHAWKNRHVC